MGLLELKILLVVIMCVPVVLIGIKLFGQLTDTALAGKKKRSARKTDEKKR